MPDDRLRHLLVERTARAERYKSPNPGRGTLNLPSRNRTQHGRRILAELEAARAAAAALGQRRSATGLDGISGMYLEFESEPNHELALRSLEAKREGIELVSVRMNGATMLATVFVPEGRLERFIKLATRYTDEDTAFGKPKHRNLLESIAHIREAVLASFWTDDSKLIPTDEAPAWWEVWLRGGDEMPSRFADFLHRVGGEIGKEVLSFLDRRVVLVRATRSQMSASAELLDCVAELRLAKEPASSLLEMEPIDQAALISDLARRTSVSPTAKTSVCLLDTGVNGAHVLIAPALAATDLHAVNPNWGVHDHHPQGHGTAMAGLALYGDLTPLLRDATNLRIPHRLESVKILPPAGSNLRHLYGSVTTEAIARAEVAAPDRSRVVCMTVTADDYRDRGRPSSWSAAVDKLTCGVDDGVRRLIVLSAGNVRENHHMYPDVNQTEEVHDPGQAWNALTVGAMTDLQHITDSTFTGWSPLAPAGGLAPSSTTSLTWNRSWPIKPDVVVEGGNMAINPPRTQADFVDSLLLLSTHHQPLMGHLLRATGETSGAAALTSRMCALIHAEYPLLWPETVRALIVHSAEWTRTMLASLGGQSRRMAMETLVRMYGFGVPSLERALYSARNALTLIAQDELQPFETRVRDGRRSYATRDMHFHRIPWPRDALLQLGDLEVELRVTLSYFIEPNPARRGWLYRHRYASHGLRFDVRAPLETEEQFRRRLNAAAREENESQETSGDSKEWDLGMKLRARGSIHSDRWRGPARSLAERGMIGVFPVIGWWRERPQFGRVDSRARYALVVSINGPSTNVDLYTPVANQIGATVQV